MEGNPRKPAASAPQVCLLTATGRSAVAVVSVVGDGAAALVDPLFRAASGRPLAATADCRLVFGCWQSSGEEVVVCRIDAETIEIQCHGGMAASRWIIESLRQQGAVLTEHPPAAPAQSPVAQAAWGQLSQALTERTAAVLLDQCRGAWDAAIDRLELWIQEGQTEAALSSLAALLSWRRLGARLTRPWRVVLCGPPNVGKSTLMNALLGYQRSITLDQPGTTRDVVGARTVIGGWPVELSDTAGLRVTADPLESAGVARAEQAVAGADLLVLVHDLTAASATAASATAASATASATAPHHAAGRFDAESTPQLQVHNKSDQSSHRPAEGICLSAVTGEGVPQLLAAIEARLVPQAPPPGAAVPFLPALAAAAAALQSELAQGLDVTRQLAACRLQSGDDC